MGRKLFVLIILIGVILFVSCKEKKEQVQATNQTTLNKVLQQSDGTIALNVDNADCYQDKVNPAANTAEWNVMVSKSGRFNVWLASATKDTTNLNYKNTVMLSILDNRIEAHPEVDKVILDSKDVTYPYFRADSFLGSLYIQDTGMYNIQIISEKIIPKDLKRAEAENSGTKVLSVILSPITQ
jgi:hypothetical protein